MKQWLEAAERFSPHLHLLQFVRWKALYRRAKEILPRLQQGRPPLKVRKFILNLLPLMVDRAAVMGKLEKQDADKLKEEYEATCSWLLDKELKPEKISHPLFDYPACVWGIGTVNFTKSSTFELPSYLLPALPMPMEVGPQVNPRWRDELLKESDLFTVGGDDLGFATSFVANRGVAWSVLKGGVLFAGLSRLSDEFPDERELHPVEDLELKIEAALEWATFGKIALVEGQRLRRNGETRILTPGDGALYYAGVRVKVVPKRLPEALNTFRKDDT